MDDPEAVDYQQGAGVRPPVDPAKVKAAADPQPETVRSETEATHETRTGAGRAPGARARQDVDEPR